MIQIAHDGRPLARSTGATTTPKRRVSVTPDLRRVHAATRLVLPVALPVRHAKMNAGTIWVRARACPAVMITRAHRATATRMAATTRHPGSPAAHARFPLKTSATTLARVVAAGLTSHAHGPVAHALGMAHALARAPTHALVTMPALVAHALTAHAPAAHALEMAHAPVDHALTAHAPTATAGMTDGVMAGTTSQRALPAATAHPSASRIVMASTTRATRTVPRDGMTKAGKARSGTTPGTITAGARRTIMQRAAASTQRATMMCGSLPRSAISAHRAGAWVRAWARRGRTPLRR